MDGVIKEDKLGLDVIYIQAKRWDSGVVGRPEIEKFIGAMHGRTRKGIFITTSDSSNEAKDYARGIRDTAVVLIDGRQLAKYVLEYGIGVKPKATYTINEIDEDNFKQ